MWSESQPTAYQLELHRQHVARRARMRRPPPPPPPPLQRATFAPSVPRIEVEPPERDAACNACMPASVLKRTKTQQAKAILAIVAAHYRQPVEVMTMASRQRAYAYVRFAAMWFLHKYLGYSTVKSGRLLNRDHTSVMNGLRKMEILLWNEAFAADFALLEAKVRERIGG